MCKGRSHHAKGLDSKSGYKMNDKLNIVLPVTFKIVTKN